MDWYLEALRKYADFDGRAGRTEYWMFSLFCFLIFFGLAFFVGVFGFGVRLLFLYILAMIIPSFSVAVRRLHDTNKSGAWMLLSLIPPIGLVVLVLMLLEGDKGVNQYGEPPLRGTTPNSGFGAGIKVIDPIEDEIIFPDEIGEEKVFEMPSDDVFL